ncbi:MAG: hypothetical protein ACR2JB_19365 [Bryobacteraceae bacterium]
MAILITLGFTSTRNFAFEAHAASRLYEPFVASGMSHAGAFVLRKSLKAALEMLVRMPIAVLALSSLGSFFNAWITTRSRSFAILAAWFTPFIFVAGAAALWYADLLERAARPPFVIAGVLTAGIAVCGAHPIWASLSRSGQRFGLGPSFSVPVFLNQRRDQEHSLSLPARG